MKINIKKSSTHYYWWAVFCTVVSSGIRIAL